MKICKKSWLALYGLLIVSAPTTHAGAAEALRWTSDGRPTAQAKALLAQLTTAADHGLQASYYGAAELEQRVAQAGSGAPLAAVALAAMDRALSAAAVRYANDLHRGHVDPRRTGLALNAPQPVDEAALLARLAKSNDVAADFRALEPDFLHYRLLEQWLVRYRALLQQQPSLTALPPMTARALKAGQPYAGANELRRLLVALGDLPAADAAPRTDGLFDSGLSAAVTRFQERHGLAVDGAMGRKTFDSLTTPLTQRVRQIELTLERWRWLPAFKSPPIIINIPQYRLFAFRNTQDRVDEILQMPVIVGQSFEEKRTPVFIAEMQQVVFRPYWDVPPTILRKELLAPIRRDSKYLARNNMEIVRGQGDDAKPVEPTSANIELLAAGQLRLRQRPGDKNALGPIKFVFPNDYRVYLHGTPAQQLFAQARRDFSHGCIRLSDPAGLAVHVLRNAEGVWTPEAVKAAMTSDQPSTRVRLKQSIPVMLLYGTALATEDGRIMFFDDIYGHDQSLGKLLPTPGT